MVKKLKCWKKEKKENFWEHRKKDMNVGVSFNPYQNYGKGGYEFDVTSYYYSRSLDEDIPVKHEFMVLKTKSQALKKAKSYMKKHDTC